MLEYIFYLVIYPLLLLTSIFLGRFMAARFLKKDLLWKSLGLESGLMGFYALLTSFTLAQSSNRSSDRNAMIHTVADGMSEVLRISNIDEPYIQRRVNQYFEDFYQIIRQPIERNESSIASRITTIDNLDDMLDDTLQRYIESNPETRSRLSLLLSKIDRMESVYYTLMHSYNKTLPRLILLILILFSLFMGLLTGFIEKYNKNHIHIVSITFVVMSIIVLNVIHDLNNPTIGLIRPDFQSISEVMRSFHLEKIEQA